MKRFRFGIVSALSFLLATACTTYPDYGHGSTGTDTVLMAAPFRGGGTEHVGETRVGAQIALGTLYNSQDFNGLARAIIQRGDNLGWVGFTCGASGFGGLYTATSGTRSYFGGSIHGAAMLIIPIPEVEFRLLGIQAALSYEGGDFHDFRQQAENITNLAPDPFLIGFGAFTEVCVRLGDTVRLGFRGGLGGAQSDFQSGVSPMPTATFGAYLTIDPIIAWLQAGGTLDTNRPAFSVGVAYRLF
jgi:hypothetical protein